MGLQIHELLLNVPSNTVLFWNSFDSSLIMKIEELRHKLRLTSSRSVAEMHFSCTKSKRFSVEMGRLTITTMLTMLGEANALISFDILMFFHWSVPRQWRICQLTLSTAVTSLQRVLCVIDVRRWSFEARVVTSRIQDLRVESNALFIWCWCENDVFRHGNLKNLCVNEKFNANASPHDAKAT